MTAPKSPDSFGPYAFTLAPAEAEAAAARLSLRIALNGVSGRTRLAVLALFMLVVVLATSLALTGVITRRLGELALILAAAAFMIQRLASLLRLRNARRDAEAAIGRLKAEGAMKTTIDASGVTLTGAKQALRLDFSDCEEAEDAGGLVYLWPRQGAPIVLPARALPEGEASRLVTNIKERVAIIRSQPLLPPVSLLRGRRS